jgi:predicted GIY-YIG superfamily endonuclease
MAKSTLALRQILSGIKEHLEGNCRTTSRYLPVVLIGYEAYSQKSDGQRREKYLKTTEGKRLFRQQYRDVLAEVNYMRV